MRKITYSLIVVISLGLSTSFSGCDSHRLDEPLYYFKNETGGTVYLSEYTELNAGIISRGKEYASGEERTLTGGAF